LVDNKILSPVLKINGKVKIHFTEDALVSITGSFKAFINGLEIKDWRAILVPKNEELEIENLSEITYLAIHGLKAPFHGIFELASNIKLNFEPVRQKIKDLIARYVPSNFISQVSFVSNLNSRGLLLVQVGELERTIEKFKKHLKLVSEAVKRGAQLIRVNINGKKFDVWIEELE
ncbi:MAG: hypothetical protein DRP08_07270, partial [Candidatus Aenigmatarchaeota archaeon]